MKLSKITINLTSSIKFPSLSKITPYSTKWLFALQLPLLAGRKTFPAISTAAGPETLTIPTADGPPPSDVTMAAIVSDPPSTWSADDLNRSSLVRISVLDDDWEARVLYLEFRNWGRIRVLWRWWRRFGRKRRSARAIGSGFGGETADGFDDRVRVLFCWWKILIGWEMVSHQFFFFFFSTRQEKKKKKESMNPLVFHLFFLYEIENDRINIFFIKKNDLQARKKWKTC